MIIDAGELASSPGELPSTAPVLPTSVSSLLQHQDSAKFQHPDSSVNPVSSSLLQYQDSMKRVGSVTQRMLSNPEPASSSAVSSLPSVDSSSVSSSQGARSSGNCDLMSVTRPNTQHRFVVSK